MNQFVPAKDFIAQPVPVASHPEHRGAAIHARQLRKAYGGNPVLRGLDLAIPAGQFVAIVGRSGCGKSTLLRLLAGLEKPDHGTITLGEPGDEKRTVRVMFQEPRLLPWARVKENIEVGLSGSGNGRDISLLATRVLHEVGLSEKASQWPAVLSGGQRQRVALGRALISRPGVLLFDEPLGALDALTRISMQHLLERVWRDQGFTAVLVTHDVSEAVSLADRVLVVEGGRIADDYEVGLARPRQRGSARLAEIEGGILGRLVTEKETEHA